MLDPADVQRVGEAAVAAARQFFRLPEEWQIEFCLTTDPGEADPDSLYARHDYLEYVVHINPNGYTDLADVWRDAGGHEVGHLMAEEALSLSDLMGRAKDPLAPHLLRALERLTMRLERLFLRECPFPGLEALA